VTTGDAKSLVRQGTLEVINRGKLDYIDTHFTADYVHHDGAATRDRAGFKTYFASMREAFPDFEFTIEDEVAEGDRVLQRVTFTGTHQGFFRGLPPTGKRVRISGFDLFRLENDKIAEQWSIFDSAGMMNQLGVLPPEGAGPGRFLRWAGRTMARMAVLTARARRRGILPK
jgi:steroid delta-isomerase-like uncharacterized protein